MAGIAARDPARVLPGARTFTRGVLPSLKPGASVVDIASRGGHGGVDGPDRIRKLPAVTSRDHLKRLFREGKTEPIRARKRSNETVAPWRTAITEFLIKRGPASFGRNWSVTGNLLP